MSSLLPLVMLVLSPWSAAEASLVPDTPSTAPDYFCTWNLQGFVSSYKDSNSQADAMTDANLFGKGPLQNWVEMFPQARRDLILVLDDTWDIPLRLGGDGRGHSKRGSLELDTERFPSYTGTPAERLAKLNRDVQARGWRGVGLWVYSGHPKRDNPHANVEQYWAERMRWCCAAGNPSTYQRLDVEYTCAGRGHVAIALYGERLILDAQGQYRTQRASRKSFDPFDDPAKQASIRVSKFTEKGGGQLLTIRKYEDLTQIAIGNERKHFTVVTGAASPISETEYAVIGFNPLSDMEERIEVKKLEAGAVEVKRASVPFPETMTFTPTP